TQLSSNRSYKMLNLGAAGQETTCVSCGGPIASSQESRVCEACGSGLVARRIMAFVVDVTVWVVLNYVVFTVLGMATLPVLVVFVLEWGSRLAFLFKDGIRGYSPGKFLFGLRVIETSSGTPADYIDSMRRNIPLLFPFVGLIVAFQLGRGTR